MSQHDDKRPNRARRAHAAQPAIRMARHAGGEPPAAEDGPFAVERLTALTHDLGNLLDGSMRCLGLARQSLASQAAGVGITQIDFALRQIETVYGAMERMADLVNAAMRGSASVVSSPTLTPAQPITLGEAIAHAVEVAAPEAAERRIEIGVHVADDVACTDVGPLYTVVLNGLRNAIEAVARSLPPDYRGPGGRIEVRATARGPVAGSPPGQRFIALEIFDDGVGVVSPTEASRAFQVGVSSKPGGLGIGLALAAEVIRELGGAIELHRRQDLADARRPGAVLRVVYPWPQPRTGRNIG